MEMDIEIYGNPCYTDKNAQGGDKVICQHCGKRLPDHVRICDLCGTAVEQQPEQAAGDLSFMLYQPESGQTPMESPKTVCVCAHCGRRQAMAEVCDWCGGPLDAQEQQNAGILVAALFYQEALEEPSPEAEEQEPEPPNKPKIQIPKKVLFVAMALLLAMAVLFGFLYGRKKTVYLLTESVTSKSETSTTVTYTYNSDGMITGYLTEKTNPPWASIITIPKLNFTYEYDFKGNIRSGKAWYGNAEILIDYIYQNGKLVDLEITLEDNDYYERRGLQLDIQCDKNGRLTRVALLGKDGIAVQYCDYVYNKDGRMVRETYGNARGSTVKIFDESGKLQETETVYDGTVQSRQASVYDDRGNLLTELNYGKGNVLQNWTDYIYDYNGDKLNALTIVYTKREADGAESVESVNFDCRWSGNQCTMTVIAVSTKNEVLRYDESSKVVFVKNAQGNITKTEVYRGEELIESVEYKYQAFLVPYDYQKQTIENNPLYLSFLERL